MLWVIHLTEPDYQEMMLWACNTMKDVDDYVKLTGLEETDYAIIEGHRIKNFGRVCGSTLKVDPVVDRALGVNSVIEENP